MAPPIHWSSCHINLYKKWVTLAFSYIERNRNSSFLQVDGWWRKLAESASKLIRMGITRSAGTRSPATKYLYMRAWCSSSCHCPAVNDGPRNPSPAANATVTADVLPLISLTHSNLLLFPLNSCGPCTFNKKLHQIHQ